MLIQAAGVVRQRQGVQQVGIAQSLAHPAFHDKALQRIPVIFQVYRRCLQYRGFATVILHQIQMAAHTGVKLPLHGETVQADTRA